MPPRVAILTGSKSDVPLLDPCVQTLTELGIEHEMHVMSAHRAPQKVQQFASGAADSGFEVIIAAAGGTRRLHGRERRQERRPLRRSDPRTKPRFGAVRPRKVPRRAVRLTGPYRWLLAAGYWLLERTIPCPSPDT